MDKLGKQQQGGEIPVDERTVLRDGDGERYAQYRSLVEMSVDLLARHTPDGVWLYASPACRALLGYEPEELQGHSWNDYVHPDDISTVSEFLSGMLAQPAARLIPHAVTYRIRRKAGDYVWFEMVGRVVTDSNSGAALEIQTSSRDVTQRSEAEAERERLVSKLQDALKAADPLNGVIAICSHCKKVRDDSGRWEQLEAYFHKHSNSLFSHGICPTCARETFREFTEELGLEL